MTTKAPHVKPDAKKVQEIMNREHARIAEADARTEAMLKRNRERIARGIESPVIQNTSDRTPGQLMNDAFTESRREIHKRARNKAATDRRDTAEKARRLSRPRDVVELETWLENGDMLLLAASMAESKDGALRVTFEALALPLGRIMPSETGPDFWTAPRPRFASVTDFQRVFGFPGDPARSREPCGLQARLFADVSHDPAQVAEYVQLHLSRIRARLAAKIRRATQTKRSGDITQTLAPPWSKPL